MRGACEGARRCASAAAAAGAGSQQTEPRRKRPVCRPHAPLPQLPRALTALRGDVAAFPADGAVVGQCPTAPASWYIQPAFLELEKRSVFADSWLHVGVTPELPEPGSYFTRRIIDEPIIVCREAETGELRAWYNVCSHHAMAVASGRGRCNTFVCPYHGWTYGTDGRLRRATTIRGMQDFSARKFGLVPVHVDTYGGLIFVNFSPTPPRALREQLHPLEEQLKQATRHTGFENLVFSARKTYDLKCNWKVFVDNYCDGGYHVPYAHKELSQNVDMAQYENQLFEFSSVQRVPTDEKDSRTQGGACYVFCYPNLMVNRYGPWLDTNTVIPIGHDRCRVIFDYWLEREWSHKDAFQKQSLESSERVQEEDVWLCENVQKGLGSRAYNTGRYNPTFESPMHHFHSLLRRHYERGLERIDESLPQPPQPRAANEPAG